VIPPTPIKRESAIAYRPFAFELLHTEGPANNMRIFHWHDFMELSYVRAGHGTYEIEGRAFQVSPGDIVVINNAERHRVTYRPEDPLHETVMHFAPELLCAREEDSLDSQYLRLFAHDGAGLSNRPELASHRRTEVEQLVSGIVREYREKRPWFELMIKSQLLALVTLLLRESGAPQTPDPRRAALRRTQIARLERILAYIRDSFAGEIRLAEIAGRFAMSPAYFSDYFRRNLGVTFSEYLSRVRIQEAVRLLDQDRMRVLEVAHACGFSSPASFYRAFRKVTGTAPREHRPAGPRDPGDR